MRRTRRARARTRPPEPRRSSRSNRNGTVCPNRPAIGYIFLFLPSLIHSFIHSFWAPLQLLKQLRPSAVFSGHTHNGCEYRHGSALEYSVPSLSWRNRDNPGYLLVSGPLIGRSGQFVANQEPPPPPLAWFQDELHEKTGTGSLPS